MFGCIPNTIIIIIVASRVVPGQYHDFGIDSILSTIPKSIDSILSTRHTAHRPVCQYVLAVEDQTRMKPACLTSKRKYFREQKQKGSDLRPKRKGVITLEKMLYISLDFSFFFPLFTHPF